MDQQTMILDDIKIVKQDNKEGIKKSKYNVLRELIYQFFDYMYDINKKFIKVLKAVYQSETNEDNKHSLRWIAENIGDLYGPIEEIEEVVKYLVKELLVKELKE